MIPAIIATRNANDRRSRGGGGSSGQSGAPRSPGSGNPPCAAFFILGIVSCALVSVGLWFMLAAVSQTREQEVEAYSRAIEVWSSERVAFAALRPSATAVAKRSGGDATASIPLLPDMKQDSNRDESNGAALPKYKAMAYRADNVSGDFVSEVDFTAAAQQLKVDHSLATHHVGANITFEFVLDGASFVTVGPFPAMRVRSQVAHGPQPAAHCKQLRGVLHGGRCWITSRLKSVCIQIMLSRAGAWKLAPRTDRAGSYGCAYAHDTWNVATYHVLPFALAGAAPAFDDLQVAVRSFHDPYFRSLELTHGSLDFGMTADDDRTLGFMMLGLGLALSFPPLFALVNHWRSHDSDAARRYRVDGDERSIGRRYAGFECE